jgi:hypothetical protein
MYIIIVQNKTNLWSEAISGGIILKRFLSKSNSSRFSSLKFLNLQASDERFLPIVSACVKKSDVVEEINRLRPSEKELSQPLISFNQLKCPLKHYPFHCISSIISLAD